MHNLDRKLKIERIKRPSEKAAVCQCVLPSCRPPLLSACTSFSELIYVAIATVVGFPAEGEEVGAAPLSR